MKEYRDGHSAEVRMRLLLNGCSLPVAQLGPDFLILRESGEYPPGDAEMSLTVDGQEERWAIHLPDGLPPRQRVVRISSLTEGK